MFFVKFLKYIIFIFAEDFWATTSYFQQRFERIVSFISNKSIQSQLTFCGFKKQYLRWKCS